MVSKIGILVLLSPRRSSLPGAPLPSSGSLGMVPRAHRYYWGAPTSHRPRSPRFSRSSSSACSPCSLSLGTASAPASLGFGRRLPSRLSRRSRWELPGSGGILVNLPCCLTPVGRPQPRLCGLVDSAFRLSEHRRPHVGLFRGSITQPVDSLSTLRVGVAPSHARLASGPLAKLWPVGAFTRWIPSLSFGCLASSSSQPSAFPGAIGGSIGRQADCWREVHMLAVVDSRRPTDCIVHMPPRVLNMSNCVKNRSAMGRSSCEPPTSVRNDGRALCLYRA